MKNDYTFYLESYGLITPKAEPGWDFGNKLKGKWQQDKNDKLKLMLGNPKVFFTFFYKIIKSEKNKLIIGQIGEGVNQNERNVESPYLMIEFIRIQ